MTGRRPTDQPGYLQSLGWSRFFEDQLGAEDVRLSPARIDAVHRSRLTALTAAGRIDVVLPARADTADYAVGDWMLVDPAGFTQHRRLDRKTLLQRRGEGRRPTHLMAANVDTLFIVTSCNADFNLARLERYLAVANDAGTDPVIVLTKIDAAPNATELARQAAALQHDLPVVTIDARSAGAAPALSRWCRAGSTVALVGSSGVGKSTLVNTLVGATSMPSQDTGSIRQSDSKGRHVTTSRSLHPMAAGGWVIDTPGIRGLHLTDVSKGIDTLFAEITELAHKCKFRDCTHSHEPGCAVLAAVAAGTLDPERLSRWRKLQTESRVRSR